MSESQAESLSELRSLQVQLTEQWVNYWQEFAHLGTWQFWVNSFLFILPLILLYFLIDRRKALLLGFYGLNVHVWMTYIHLFGAKLGYWDYPHPLFPFIPTGIEVDASFIPVAFMFVYQWTLNHQKNYYIYSFILSLVVAFIFKPIMVSLDLFGLYKGVNYFHLLLALMVIFLISKCITNIFVYFQKQEMK